MTGCVLIYSLILTVLFSFSLRAEPQGMISGGPGKGGIGVDRGIAALDMPTVTDAKTGDTWLRDKDIVLGIVVNGQARAYPKRIMVWHEIANDVVGGKPVLITYCPLCGTGIAFKRSVQDEVTRFGTSGKLYNSNLVMYDEKTKSMWTQVDGKVLQSQDESLKGKQLELLSLVTMTWKDWKKEHPNTQVLSKNTGMKRDYNRDPYASYYQSRQLYFGYRHIDAKLHPKQMVAGITVDGVDTAYSVKAVAHRKVVNDKVGSQSVLVVVKPDVSVAKGFQLNPVIIFNRKVDDQELKFILKDGILTDEQTGSTWNFKGHCVSGHLQGKQLKVMPFQSAMWFAWKKFHPQTKLWAE